MSSNVWRPKLEEPDVIWFKADEAMSYWIEAGLKAQAGDLRGAIQDHLDLCGPGATVCHIRNKWLVETYGSLEEAAKHEPVLRNCLQDLAYLYTELGKITQILYQLHELRLDPTKQGDDPELTDWTPRNKLQEIKTEIAHRVEASKEETGLMPIIRDDEVDTDIPEGATKSILGLTDNLPAVDGQPSKSAKELPPGKLADGKEVKVTLPEPVVEITNKDDVE